MNMERELLQMENLNDMQKFEKLCELGWIKSSRTCLYCSEPMLLKKTKDSIDGLNWRCMNGRCIHYQTTKSIREGSFLAEITIDIRKIIKIIIYWSSGINVTIISRLVSASLKTIRKVRMLILKKIDIFFENNPIQLGGPGIKVQIDETMISHKVKSHRGRGPREQVWVLTIADVSYSPAKCYYEIVPDRGSATLMSIIARIVRPGSIITTDEWASYRQLGNDPNYEHRTICHRFNFICPITGEHTQNAESNNNKLKLRIIKAKGADMIGRRLIIIEALFFDHFNENPFLKIISILKI